MRKEFDIIFLKRLSIQFKQLFLVIMSYELLIAV